MSVSDDFKDHLLDLLDPLGAITVRRMFGGAGIFYDGLMFGLVADHEVYLKVDAATKADFEKAGSGPFLYMKKDREVALKSYYLLPEEVVDDADAFRVWARAAIDAALRSDKKKAPSAKVARKRR